MTDKQLKRLKRNEILELMIEQSKEIEELKAKLEAAEKKLEDRKIKIQQAGSIAEAALALNHIFEDAQKAADQYLENVKKTENVKKAGKARERNTAKNG